MNEAPYDPNCPICNDAVPAPETYYTELDPLDIDYQKAKDDKNGFND